MSRTSLIKGAPLVVIFNIIEPLPLLTKLKLTVLRQNRATPPRLPIPKVIPFKL